MIYTIGGIIFLGIMSQWIAWRLKVPVIIILLSVGFLAGPVLGVLTPMAYMSQDLVLTIVELSVALILFDGAMQLKFTEFKTVADGLKRILTLGVLFHFIFISAASFFLVDSSVAFAFLLAGILIVTGPTVVIPALREAKINKKSANYLKWEGIITDPIGAIIAIVVYDAMVLSSQGSSTQVTIMILKIALISFSLSFILKEVVKWAFKKNRLPDYLKLPFITSVVLCSFVFSNEIQHGSGLLTVTLLGMLIGNSKIDILLELREFKENITTMCISFVFIIITTSTSFESFSNITFPQLMFVLLVSFVLRPIAIFVSTYKSKMSLKEKFLIGSFGPRGIVAVSVAAALSSEMANDGLNQFGVILLPMTLMIVITTVIAHSLYLPFLSRKLELDSEVSNGVIIIGTMPWVVDLASKLQDLGIPVLVTSASWYKLAPFRNRGINTFYGQILNQLDHEDFSEYGSLLAMSENDSFNSLSCEKFSKQFGHDNVYKLKQAKNFVHDKYNVDKSTYCVYINNLDLKFENLMKYYQHGWRFKYTRLTENFNYPDFLRQNEQSIVCMKIKVDGSIVFGSHFEKDPKEGEILS